MASKATKVSESGSPMSRSVIACVTSGMEMQHLRLSHDSIWFLASQHWMFETVWYNHAKLVTWFLQMSHWFVYWYHILINMMYSFMPTGWRTLGLSTLHVQTSCHQACTVAWSWCLRSECLCSYDVSPLVTRTWSTSVWHSRQWHVTLQCIARFMEASWNWVRPCAAHWLTTCHHTLQPKGECSMCRI